MKNNLTYYQHKVDSHNHWKFKLLRKQYGWGGEGKFWALNNEIAACDNCTLDLTDEGRKTSLAIDLDFSVEEFDQYLAFLVDKCKLIKATDKGIATDITQENLDKANEERERKRLWVKEKRDSQKTPTDQLQDDEKQDVDVDNSAFDVEKQQTKTKLKESITEIEVDSKEANASGEAGASPPSVQALKIMYKNLATDRGQVEQFVAEHRPAFVEPYAYLWNLAAKEKHWPLVQAITDERRKKIKTRAAEKEFDIVAILLKARDSPKLHGTNWFSFDWIIKNQSNYTKVLEGNYLTAKTHANGTHQQTSAGGAEPKLGTSDARIKTASNW
jgi:hypothetical protein